MGGGDRIDGSLRMDLELTGQVAIITAPRREWAGR
jgi:hypothetical protein